MGGGYEAPSQPAQPSTAEGIKEWVSSMPQVYQTQLEYAPKQAEQQVQLAQQYAGQLGTAYKTAQEAMYPETSKLQEQLAKQASEGMSSQMPTWMKDQYQSELRANLGSNVGSGMAADYTSRGLLEQNKTWQDYYRNLGLAAAGRQSLSNPVAPSSTDYMSNFTPSSVLGYTAQNYGTAGNIYGNQLNYASQGNAANMNLLGSLIGAGGTMGGAALMMSSRRYKKNIRLWA